MKKYALSLIFLVCQMILLSQDLSGIVVDQEDKPVAFAQGWVLPDSIPINCDEFGEFELLALPASAKNIQIIAVGYESERVKISSKVRRQGRIRIRMASPNWIGRDIVVSATRTARSRKDLPVVVDILDQQTFENVHAVNLSEGLNYQCGVRVESNCQTCNYSQIRMNGLGGGYTQILINSRPIFSSLVGLYGLEQVPAQLIDRVEITRGGGSAMFGANAIGGTVNIITRQARNDFTNVSYQSNMIDETSIGHSLQFHSSMVNEKKSTGINLTGSYITRPEWDANDDGYSELSRLAGRQLGLGGFVNGKKWSLDYQLLAVHEDRNGGDQLDQPAHLRTQSEERRTQFFTGNVDLNWEVNDRWSNQWYAGALHTDRYHYTGIDGQNGYGQTDNVSIQAGNQWRWQSKDETMEWLMGFEYQFDDIRDEIEAYNYLIDQSTEQWSTFLQADKKFLENWHFLGGIRLQNHSLTDQIHILPRAAIKYDVWKNMSVRASYGRGFRPPQAFDSDLHIAFAGGGISTINLDPDLTSEFSDSYNVSLDYDRPAEHMIYGFTLNAFLTNLNNAFVLEEAGHDSQGNTILEKINSSGSQVGGLSLELRANIDNRIEWDAGITIQQSEYKDSIQWSENLEGSRQYLRTPDMYGFFTGNYYFHPSWELMASCAYTGRMLVPHFGGAPETPEDDLYHSDPFWDVGVFLKYKWQMGSSLFELSGGVQNVFNSYQDNFDTGKNRDSNFIFGPVRPRTFTIRLNYNLI